MTSKLVVASLLLIVACKPASRNDGLHPIPSTPIATTGPLARRFLSTPGFTWRSFQSKHVRIHMASDMDVRRAGELADSLESARRNALALLAEPDAADEPLLEAVLVETRDDMQRIAGRPAGGSGFPTELTVIMVSGTGFHAPMRHELMHAYAARRWGTRHTGSWLNEGLATLAYGTCQGQQLESVAAGYQRSGKVPALDALTSDDFYANPELPAYFTSASLAGFLKRREGIEALRSLWRGQRAGVDATHPLGADTERLRTEWQRQLATTAPATVDSARLHRDGC